MEPLNQNKMKQTAVEWLVNSLDYNQNMLGIKEIIDQAKVMEKEQIMDAFNGEPHCDGDGDRYYNETFKSE